MTFYKRQDCFKDIGQIFKYLSEEHKKFCESDKLEEKADALRLLKGHARTYLNCARQDLKFEIEQVGRVLMHTIQNRKESFEAREASAAFENLAKYPQCLLEQPWRKEFKTMSLYSGYYVHNVQAHLDNAHEVLVAMGYTHIDHETLKLAGPPDLARLLDVSRSCFLASQECEILEQIADFVKSKTGVEVQPAEVYHYRCNHMGDVTTIGTRICYDINQREHELKEAKLSRSTGHLRSYDPTPISGAETGGEKCDVPERELVEKVLYNTEHSNRQENIYDPVSTETFRQANAVTAAYEFKTPADFGRDQSSGRVGHSNRRKTEVPSGKSVETFKASAERTDRQRRNSSSSSVSSSLGDKYQPINKGKVPRESLGLALASTSSMVEKHGANGRKSLLKAEANTDDKNHSRFDDIVAEAGSYKFSFPAALNTSIDQPRLFSTPSSRSPDEVERKSSVSSDTSSWDYRSNGISSKINPVAPNTQSSIHAYFPNRPDEIQVQTTAVTSEGFNASRLNATSFFESSIDEDSQGNASNVGNYNLHSKGEEKRAIKTKEILSNDGAIGMKKKTDDPGIVIRNNSHQTSEILDDVTAIPWKCPHCTYMNHCEGKICQICSKSKDFQFQEESQMPDASFVTLAISPKLTKKSYAIAVDSKIPPDSNVLHLRSEALSESLVKTIECPHCTLQNPFHRIVCEVCDARLKPSPE